MDNKLTATERFWKNTKINDAHDCWPWIGAMEGEYGILRTGKRRKTRASRFSWALANGRPVPRGLYILHRCDNPPCVNPRHLYAGTAADNVADMIERGRKYRMRSEDTNTCRLRAEEVRQIRASVLAPADLAKAFGVSVSNIYMIRRGATWKSV